MQLRGKVAIVTGASRGIGKGIAMVLGREGASVAVVARTDSPGKMPGTIQETAGLIDEAGGDAVPVRCDVTSEDDVKAMVKKVMDTYGRIDLLVNNAGGSSSFGPVKDFPLHRFDRVITLNLRGTFLCTREVLPHMIAQKGGVIVNISSDSAGTFAFPDDTVYGMVKAALERFTLGVANEVKQHNVSVVALWPAKVKTEGAEAIHPSDFDWGGWITPEGVGPGVVWLAQQTPKTCTMRVLDLRHFGVEWGQGAVSGPPVGSLYNSEAGK